MTWACYLKTFDRRILAGPVGKHELAREVPRSLSAIGSAIKARGISQLTRRADRVTYSCRNPLSCRQWRQRTSTAAEALSRGVEAGLLGTSA